MSVPGGESQRVLFAAASIALAVESASNALFVYGFGQFPVALGGVAFLADGALMAAGSASIAAFQAHAADKLINGKANRGAAVVFLSACIAYSGGAMAYHLFKLQREHGAKEAAAAAEYRLARGEFDSLSSEMDTLGNPRPVAVVTAEQGGARPEFKTWRATRECTEATEPASKDACSRYLELSQEIGRAARKIELQPKLDKSRLRLEKLTPPTEKSAFESALTAWLPWAFALAIGLCGTFGFALSRRAPASASPAAGRRAPPDPTPGPATAAGEAPSAPAPRASGDLAATVAELAAGSLSLPGAVVLQDGWVKVAQDTLGRHLGVSKTTVNNRIKALRAAGRLDVRTDASGSALKAI